MKILDRFFKKTDNKKEDLKVWINNWDNKELLENMSLFFDRAKLSTEFIHDEHGFIEAEVLHITCGDKVISSPPCIMNPKLEYVIMPGLNPEERKRLN